ncbi:MAG: fibronectin type III domain-containing protein [Candidatus Hatepunaea meridiana]|nr:fibronectin type III domain-containing protein [Candidatus Hatepunaea meridiana]
MRIFTITILLIFGLTSFGLIGCDDDDNPVVPSETVPPVAPSNLTAQLLSATVISLSWLCNADNEDGFEIEESIGDDSNFSIVDSTGRNATSLILTHKQPETTYYYRVRAYNTSGYSDHSNQATIITSTVLNKPDNLEARIISESEIRINWVHDSDDEDGFIIEQSIDNNRSFTYLDSIDQDTTNIILSGKQAGITYYFRVFAYDDISHSNYSNEVSVTTSVPRTPRDLSGAAVSETQIELMWCDISNNEDGFIIEESIGNNESFSVIDSTDHNIESLTLNDKQADTTYYYRIQSYNNIGNSVYTREVSAVILPRTPVNLTAVAVTPFGVHISWSLNSSNEDGFHIEESVNDTSDFTLINSPGSGITSISLNDKQAGTTYHYRIRAYNAFGNSTFSEVSTASIPVWSKTYGGNERDICTDFLPISDEGYIATGYTSSSGDGEYDVLLIKMDNEGNELWSRTLGGNGSDKGSSVQPTSDGGYIITGLTRSYGSGRWDVLLIKTDSEGGLQWMKTFGRSGEDWGACVKSTLDGGFIIIGTTYSYITDNNAIWLIKTDESGNQQWNRVYDQYDEESRDGKGLTIHLAPDGGYIIAGTMLIKTNSEGYIQWSRTFGNGTGNSVELTMDGGYIVVADTVDDDDEILGVMLIKMDTEGNEQWCRTFTDGRGYSVQPAADGGFLITGETAGYYGDRDCDMWLIKTDEFGFKQWNRNFGGSGKDWGIIAYPTIDNGFLLVGSTESYGNGSVSMWLVKIESQLY